MKERAGRRSKPLVTIVIPFHNDPFVGEAVESALAQTHEPIEIIVVDDGSVREAERLRKHQQKIVVLGKANGGTASALNHGFRMASGEWLVWLSSDDRLLPDKVERQLARLETTGAWIGHTAFRLIDEAGRKLEDKVRLEFPGTLHFYRSFLNGNAVNGCTVMMRKRLFDKLGGFDESLRFTHDYDFWLRSILAGYPLAYLDEPLTEYRQHDSMGTVRHRPEIEREFRAIAARYRSRVERLLSALEKPAMRLERAGGAGPEAAAPASRS